MASRLGPKSTTWCSTSTARSPRRSTYDAAGPPANTVAAHAHGTDGTREQVDTARSHVDELREQIGELRAGEATARAERDAACAELERERSHGEQRLTDLRTSFQEHLDELRAERASLQTQVDQLRAATSKPKTQRKTPSE